MEKTQRICGYESEPTKEIIDHYLSKKVEVFSHESYSQNGELGKITVSMCGFCGDENTCCIDNPDPNENKRLLFNGKMAAEIAVNIDQCPIVKNTQIKTISQT